MTRSARLEPVGLSPDRMATAAVYRSRGSVEVQRRPVRRPEPDEVVVEVAYCGVCGSDLHLIVEGWGRPGDVLGHEWSGTVLEAGTRSGFEPGQRVLAGPAPKCGICSACRAGRPSQCNAQAPMTGEFDGAFATHVITNADRLLLVPDDLDIRTAALAEPLAVALHAITCADPGPEASVLVTGAGPIGALAAATLLDRGYPVTICEPSPVRMELAMAVGATVVTPEKLAVFTMAEVDAVAEPAYDVVIETSGRRLAIEAGFQQLRRGGRLVMVGTGIDPPSFDPNRMIVLELAVCGAFTYDADGFERALDLLAGGRLPVEVLIDSAEYGLTGVGEAAANLAAGAHAGKVMIVPGREEP